MPVYRQIDDGDGAVVGDPDTCPEIVVDPTESARDVDDKVRSPLRIRAIAGPMSPSKVCL